MQLRTHHDVSRISGNRIYAPLGYCLALILLLRLGTPGSRAADTTDLAGAMVDAAVADYGRGDFEAAWFRFWMLASGGNAAAQFNLAQLYRLGRGIPTDLSLARHWYAEAATQGHGYAQYNLGLMYEFGHRTARDPTQARTWYRLAATQNIEGAQTGLRRLETNSQR